MSMEKKPRQFTFPTAFTILFILLVLIALATWVIPAGSYELDADGAPIPGTYQQVPSNPQKLLVSALMGPINGMYGIEDETGNVNVWNSGELFGAIDVALFVLIIGGFLGVTMKTGAINAGIACNHDQPSGRIARGAVRWPGLECAQARLLISLLSRIEVAEIADECRHGLRPGRCHDRADPARVGHDAASGVSKNSPTGLIS